ncbi:MAG: preprotein translocase subunit SecE [Spirochaetes bacterium]|jgi:preprotein translocase subunit SecE|nr:preprotein translocase subunit SecE [Spirochaetota bacterium]
MDAFTNYLKSTANEMKQVSWPTQSQALKYTALVIAISAFTALFVAGFDYVFTQFIDFLVKRI